MSSNSKVDRLIRQFCMWLGRYGRWATFLDRIAVLVCPAFVDPRLLPAVAGDMTPLPHLVLMTGVHSNQGGIYNPMPAPQAPLNPGPGDPGDPPHFPRECEPDRYHGMHGAPCAFHGGTDKKCPTGTQSGLWWRFTVQWVGIPQQST